MKLIYGKPFVGHVGLSEVAAKDWARQARVMRGWYGRVRVVKRWLRAAPISEMIYAVIVWPIAGSAADVTRPVTA